jgi:hypothetical protein
MDADYIINGDRYVELTDCNGEDWVWNGVRVYHVGAEAEFKRDGEPLEENGYYASTRAQAEFEMHSSSGCCDEDEEDEEDEE